MSPFQIGPVMYEQCISINGRTIKYEVGRGWFLFLGRKGLGRLRDLVLCVHLGV